MTPRMGRSLAVAAALSAALCPCPCPAGQAGGEADPTIKRFAAFFRSVATGPVVTVKRRADVDWEARDGSGAGKARIADTTVSRRRPPVWPTSGAPRAITVNRLRRGSATALTTGHLVSWMHDTWQVDVVVTRAKGSTEALATDVADRLEQALSGQPVVPGTRPPMRSGGATPTAPPRETTSPDPTAPANPAGTGMLHLRTLHTITYEQISLFTANLYLGSGRYPMLSRNGQRIAFAMVPDQNDAEKRERVGVINLDGSGFRIVDAYKPQLYTSPAVTISGDGAWVASTEGRQVRLAAADGTGARTVVSFAANVGTVRLSHNGRLLYVQLMAPAPLAGSNAPLDRGIYVVNSDGSGLRQLVGTAAIAGALGIPPADVGSVSAASGMTGGMDLSEDGRRLVFGAHTRGADHVFAVNTDGSGLHRVFGPVQYCFAVAISGDGSRVAATLQEPSVAGYQGWVCDFAGGGARRLTAKAGYNDPIWLSRDGAFAVYGYESILYRTDGSARVPISTPASVGGGPRLNAERLQGLMMSGDPRRCYCVADGDNGAYQLVRIDLDGAGIGLAPRLSDARIDRTSFPADDRTTATLRVRMQTSGALVGKHLATRGYVDGALSPSFGLNSALTDVGSGEFAAADFRASTSVAPGPHMMRLYAEVKHPDGRRAATAVQFGPLTVTPR